MNKYFTTLTNERGDVLPNYRAQVVDNTGSIVTIYRDKSGTRFTDASGNIINYATASNNGRVSFYFEAEEGQVLQTLDAAGDLVDSEPDFSDNLILANLPGNIAQSAVTDLTTDLAAKAASADLAATTSGKGAELVGFKSSLTGSVAREAKAKLAERVTAADFGATGDGTTDDTVALQAWADSGAKHLILGDGTFNITDTVTIPPTFEVLDFGGGTISYSGTQDRAALVVGNNAASLTTAKVKQVKVISATTSNWLDLDYIGVQLYAHRFCDIQIEFVRGFHTGVQCRGDGSGWAYNNVRLGYVVNNKYGINLHSVGGSSGFVNENLFIGGEFQIGSGINDSEDAWGVLFSTEGGSPYLNHNRNVFLKPSFEMGNAVSGTVREPVLFDGCGQQNRIVGARVETGRGGIATFQNNAAATLNIVEVGYLGGSFITRTITETGGAFGNFLTQENITQSFMPSWHSGPLVDRISAYDATNTYVTGDLLLARSGVGFPAAFTTSIRARENSVEIPAGRAIGTRVSTVSRKRFLVKIATPGNSGRVFVTAYDASGAQLPTTTDYVNGLTASVSFGGGWQTTSDGFKDVQFSVTDAVKSVIVLITGGTASANVSSFQIIGLDQTNDGGLNCSSGLDGDRFARFCASGGPGSGIVGRYRRGEMIYNAAAASAAPIGYPCFTTGYLAEAWAISTAYEVGQLRLNGSNVYVCRTAGTSAGAGGPTGTGTSIADGTVVWDYKGLQATFGTGPNAA